MHLPVPSSNPGQAGWFTIVIRRDIRGNKEYNRLGQNTVCWSTRERQRSSKSDSITLFNSPVLTHTHQLSTFHNAVSVA